MTKHQVIDFNITYLYLSRTRKPFVSDSDTSKGKSEKINKKLIQISSLLHHPLILIYGIKPTKTSQAIRFEAITSSRHTCEKEG